MMRPVLLLSVSLPLVLFGGCGKKDPVAEVKPVEEKQQEVTPTEEAPVLKYETEGDAVTITGCDKKASGALTIPAAIEGKPVTSIGHWAFRGCTHLTSITIGNSVTSIGSSAFIACTSLTSVTIPDSVTSIRNEAFRFCTRLTTIEVGAGNVNYTDVNGVLFNKEKTDLHTYPASKTGDKYNIPDGVTSIRHEAFNKCSSLTSITIPDSVTSIGDSAFRGCTALTSITIPDSVTNIGNYAFSGCTSLTSITITDGINSIGGAAFADCTSLTSITFGENSQLTSIRHDAFADCTSLTSITIPDSVTSIWGGPFNQCKSLTAVTFLGDAPKAGEQVFKDAPPTIYRKPEAKGWGETWGGRPVKLISEKP